MYEGSVWNVYKEIKMNPLQKVLARQEFILQLGINAVNTAPPTMFFLRFCLSLKQHVLTNDVSYRVKTMNTIPN